MSKPVKLRPMSECFASRHIAHPIRGDHARLARLAREMRETGISCAAVARREGINHDLLWRIIRHADIRPRDTSTTARQRVRERLGGGE